MFLRKLNYCLKEAILNIRRNLFLNLITIGTISTVLFILSTFLLLSLNLRGIIQGLGDRLKIILYLSDEITQEEIKKLIRELANFNEIQDIHYNSREDALNELKRILKTQDSLLDNLDPNPLPQSLEIKVKREFLDSFYIEALVEKLKKCQGVKDIEYGNEWLKNFTTVFNFLNLLGTFLIGMLILATVFIISNTIKLSIYNRSTEIEIMKLVGATNRFIRFPFFLEGLFQGLCGSFIALVLLFVVYQVINKWLSSHHFLKFGFLSLTFVPRDLIGIIILSGAALGGIGGITSLGRFLNK